MKPIQLISANAAFTLRMCLMCRYDRLVDLFPMATHRADLLQGLEQLTHLCSELGVDSDDIFTQPDLGI